MKIMRRSKKKYRVLSIFCVVLTIASFFGGTTITAEASNGRSYLVWKECTSVDELEAYLEKKCGENDDSDSYWKNIKIISRAKKGYYSGNYYSSDYSANVATNPTDLTSGSYYEFRESSVCSYWESVLGYLFAEKEWTNGFVYSKEHWETNHFIVYVVYSPSNTTLIEPNNYTSSWAVFDTNWFSGNDEETLNNKYLITSSDDDYTVKIRATTTEAVDYSRHWITGNPLLVNAVFENRTTFQLDWSFLEKYEAYMNLNGENPGAMEKSTFGLDTNTIGGHTYFNLIAMNSKDGLYTDYLFTPGGVATALSEEAEPFSTGDESYTWGKQFFTTENSNYFMIYLPVEGSACNMVAATIDNTSVNWVENWDWKKYYESTKVKDLSYYREVSGTFTLSSGTTVFTGDTYIKPGATLVIPEGATMIIGSNSVLLIDGLIENQGTLIVESGATVSYLSHDIETNQSMYSVVCVEENNGLSYDRYSESLRGVYLHNMGSYYEFEGIGLSGYHNGRKFPTSKTNLSFYPWAVMSNGIDNNGSFVVRENAKVDIPRFTQISDGTTWLSGTMNVEEMIYIGSEPENGYSFSSKSDTIENWRDDTVGKLTVTESKGIQNADYKINIDTTAGGKLYVCQSSTIKDGDTSYDNHIALWMIQGSQWGNTLTLNEDVWSTELDDSDARSDHASYPMAALLSGGINVYPGDSSKSLWEAVGIPDQMKDSFLN